MGCKSSVRWGVAIGLALSIGLGCKTSPPQLARISEVRLSTAGITNHPWLGLSPAEVEKRGSDSLSRTGKLKVKALAPKEQDGDQSWHATLEIVHVRTVPPALDEEGARADVGVLVTLMRGGSRIRGDGVGQSPFAPHDPEIRGEAFRRALDGALDHAAGLIVLQLGVASKSEEELIADLGAEDADLRDLAIRILTERKSVAAVDHLVLRLSDPDRGIQLRSVGALVEIGEPSAAPALVDATAQRDPGFVIQVIYALGELGGDDAEAFLFTASTGHPEAAVRRAAGEALEQLRSKASAPVQQTHRLAP